MRSPAPVHDDPGLQPERTQLAWVRTTLSFMAVGLLALRLGVTAGIDVSAIILVIVAVVVLVVANDARRHRRSVHGINQGVVEPATSAVLVVGGGMLLLELITLVLIVGARG
ncbi:Uncharacterized membrane protein YidH, DUF202 family [Raineyella antarctica]|uniref:Uncharacterized membrane protein YidH, DUF202 family n=1 Tax=Raineyella antarctica TaxID=1577474 RepID=A0A1G6ILE1_9ACTN|nr:DUF202 domain-containing protein [Raineyella antarctica]SDC07297.1 Uncharacterized membrane protein YidH, DUF202 family [Raineyella antarctica]